MNKRTLRERDWRPAPGTKEAIEADEMRAKVAQNPLTPKEEPQKNKRKRKQ